MVALRKESVDRNHDGAGGVTIAATVALRKESVDRNIISEQPRIPGLRVALRKESVDRNPLGQSGARNWQRSLSARRAWIEMA